MEYLNHVQYAPMLGTFWEKTWKSQLLYLSKKFVNELFWGKDVIISLKQTWIDCRKLTKVARDSRFSHIYRNTEFLKCGDYGNWKEEDRYDEKYLYNIESRDTCGPKWGLESLYEAEK